VSSSAANVTIVPQNINDAQILKIFPMTADGFGKEKHTRDVCKARMPALAMKSSEAGK
jgi:hypothetical protein